MNSKRNVGSTDRLIRFVVAGILAIAYLMGWVSGWIGGVALVVALALVVTGIMRSCYLYTLLGINTCAAGE